MQHRGVSRRSKPEIEVLAFERIRGELRKLPRPIHTRRIDHEWRQNLGVTVLPRVGVQHEGGERTLHLMAERNKSGRVEVTLAPGQSLEHRVDLQAWAVRPDNGGKDLAEGDYELRASYEVAPGEPVWSGKLAAGPTTVHVAARPK